MHCRPKTAVKKRSGEEKTELSIPVYRVLPAKQKVLHGPGLGGPHEPGQKPYDPVLPFRALLHVCLFPPHRGSPALVVEDEAYGAYA